MRQFFWLLLRDISNAFNYYYIAVAVECWIYCWPLWLYYYDIIMNILFVKKIGRITKNKYMQCPTKYSSLIVFYISIQGNVQLKTKSQC